MYNSIDICTSTVFNNDSCWDTIWWCQPRKNRKAIGDHHPKIWLTLNTCLKPSPSAEADSKNSTSPWPRRVQGDELPTCRNFPWCETAMSHETPLSTNNDDTKVLPANNPGSQFHESFQSGQQHSATDKRFWPFLASGKPAITEWLCLNIGHSAIHSYPTFSWL